MGSANQRNIRHNDAPHKFAQSAARKKCLLARRRSLVVSRSGSQTETFSQNNIQNDVAFCKAGVVHHGAVTRQSGGTIYRSGSVIQLRERRISTASARRSGCLFHDRIPFNCITGRIALVASVISLTAPVQLVIPTHRAYVTGVLR